MSGANLDLVRLLLWCLWQQLRDERQAETESEPLPPFFLLAYREIAAIREREHARIRARQAGYEYDDDDGIDPLQKFIEAERNGG